MSYAHNFDLTMSCAHNFSLTMKIVCITYDTNSKQKSYGHKLGMKTKLCANYMIRTFCGKKYVRKLMNANCWNKWIRKKQMERECAYELQDPSGEQSQAIDPGKGHNVYQVQYRLNATVVMGSMGVHPRAPTAHRSLRAMRAVHCWFNFAGIYIGRKWDAEIS